MTKTSYRQTNSALPVGCFKALPLDVIAKPVAVNKLPFSPLAGTLHDLKSQWLVYFLNCLRCWSLDSGFVNRRLDGWFVHCWSLYADCGFWTGINGRRLRKLVRRVCWRIELFGLKDICWQDWQWTILVRLASSLTRFIHIQLSN